MRGWQFISRDGRLNQQVRLKAIDALEVAQGTVACYFEFSEVEKTLVWSSDATTALHDFACWCAEQALLAQKHLRRESDPRSWKAIEQKRLWIRNEGTLRQLETARDASKSAYRRFSAEGSAYLAALAAYGAANESAWYSAWASSRDAALSLAAAARENSADSAEWHRAYRAEWINARQAQNAELERLLAELREKAEAGVASRVLS